ncbi:MAG: SUMF1/EgtB/PvdO family nonheme iron enzyme [Planctomycetota bacterium]
MKSGVAALMVLCSLCGLARGEALKVPAGCRAAESAAASIGGYADRIIHEKTGMEMALVKAGAVTMGDRRTPHRVTVMESFYMGRTEATNAQYRKFIEESGYDGKSDTDPAYDLYLRHFRGKSIMSAEDGYPIVWVSWKNAKAFCDWAGLALPSESQWEYACRAGSYTSYYFGEDEKEFDKYGWALTSKEYHTHAVGQKLPNAWGLYDMLGNVWEWVEDDFAESYDGSPTDGSARLEDRMTKTLRGGCWGSGVKPYACGSGARFNGAPTNAAGEIGFRAILVVPELSLPAGSDKDSGFAARYTFDEGSSDVVKDASGKGNDGKNLGARYVALGEGKGFALAFETPEASVDCGNDPSLDLANALTIEMWFFPQTAIQGGQAGLAGKHYNSFLVTYTGSCWFYISGGKNHCRAEIPAGTWHHIAAAYDGKVLKLYVDGALADSRGYGYPALQGGNFFLGWPGDKDIKADPLFRFMLDDVRVYDRALSAEEIAKHCEDEAGEKR